MVIIPDALICGVTSSVTPMSKACSCIDVVGVVVPAVAPAIKEVVVEKKVCRVVALITAVWLFRVEIFGLERTLTSPCSSSACKTNLRAPVFMVKLVKPPPSAVVRPVHVVRPV